MRVRPTAGHALGRAFPKLCTRRSAPGYRPSPMKVSILGCGVLGESILAGLCKPDGPASPSEMVVTARRQSRCEQLAQRYAGVAATLDNAQACARAEAVVVAVKPQKVRELVPAVADSLAGRLAISTCAGVPLADLQAWAPGARWIRAMPNTPATIGEGMTVLSPSGAATAEDRARAAEIFGAVGRCLELEEKHMDAVTGLSGSGPAFAFVVLEALADGGVMMGLPRAAALELAAQTMQGAARLALASQSHPAELKDQVTTPAGCTIAGLLTLEDGGIRSTLARAIQEATRVAAGLGAPPPA